MELDYLRRHSFDEIENFERLAKTKINDFDMIKSIEFMLNSKPDVVPLGMWMKHIGIAFAIHSGKIKNKTSDAA